VRPGQQLDAEIEKLKTAAGAELAVSLPVVRMFKLGAYFDIEGEGLAAPATGIDNQGIVTMSAAQKIALNVLQRDLPLAPSPFAGMAREADMTVETFLDVCRELLESGAVRRFSASINHRRAGFSANAMTCWAAPPEKVDSVGNRLAALKQVSHCYERATGHLWRHNIFAMVHGRAREECQEVAESISAEMGLADRLLLYSTREFKKARVIYTV
jgi:DNA-binding Lrp family transcriptional regulator